jgi:hypothetical protein
MDHHAPSRPSRLQHGGLRVLDERVLVVPVLRIDGDADVHLEAHLDALHRARLARQFRDPPGRGGGLLGVGEPGHQKAEFGVGQSGKRIRSAQAFLNPADHRADQLIREGSTEGVRNQPEELKVHHEHRRRLLRAIRGQDGLIDAVVKQHLVAQPCGVIGQRQQLLIGADFRHVVQDGDAEPVAMPVQGAERGVHMETPAVAAAPISARTSPSLRRNRRG